MIQSRYDILVLGTVQDGGYPHIDCKSRCCLDAWKDASLKKYISSIAIVDHEHKKYFLVDITPDFSEQLNMLYKTYSAKYVLSGIQQTNFPIANTEQNAVLQNYMKILYNLGPLILIKFSWTSMET